jgi:hypothetical protein
LPIIDEHDIKFNPLFIKFYLFSSKIQKNPFLRADLAFFGGEGIPLDVSG